MHSIMLRPSLPPLTKRYQGVSFPIPCEIRHENHYINKETFGTGRSLLLPSLVATGRSYARVWARENESMQAIAPFNSSTMRELAHKFFDLGKNFGHGERFRKDIILVPH